PSAIEKSPLDFADEAEASGRETAAPEVPPSEEVPLATVPGAGQAVEDVVAEPPTVRESRKRAIPTRWLLLVLRHILPSSQGVVVAEEPGSENASFPIEVLIQDRELEIKNLEVLLETEAEMKKAADGKNAELMRELEDIRAQFSGLKAFADVVSAGVAKGMSEGLKHGVEHGRSQLGLESIE
nr:hypothetical protein [Tanacetum cinerariifolium]